MRTSYGDYFGSQSSRYMEKFTELQVELRHEDEAIRKAQLIKSYEAAYGSQSTPTQTMERARAEALADVNPIGANDE